MNESNTNASRDVLEIDLWKLLGLWLRRWRLILVCGLALAAAAAAYTALLVTPLYRADVMVYVNSVKASQQVDYISASNLATSQQLVNTYVNIIRSDTVLEKVARAAGLNYSAEQIRSMMTAEQVDETELFTVYITHPDPVMAAEIANAVAEVAPGEIESFVDGSSTKIIDYARTPDSPYTPSYRRNILLGGLAGCFLAVLYVSLRQLLDVRVKSGDELSQLTGLPMLGQIPVFAEEKGKLPGHEAGQKNGKGAKA